MAKLRRSKSAIYDALHARFVALCFTQGKSPNFSKFYLAVLQTNDARGAWWTYAFDMTLDGEAFRCVIRKYDGNFRTERMVDGEWRVF